MRSNQTPYLHSGSRHCLGMTLIELLVVLAVLAVIVAFAAPSFREISMNNRSTSTINDLLADLSIARSEAVKRARSVSISRTGDDWGEGWQVFVDQDGDGVLDEGDDELLKQVAAINPAEMAEDHRFILRGVSGITDAGVELESITFGALGQTRDPNNGGRFYLCRPDGDAAKSSGIRIDVSGRAQSVRNIGGLGLGCD